MEERKDRVGMEERKEFGSVRDYEDRCGMKWHQQVEKITVISMQI